MTLHQYQPGDDFDVMRDAYLTPAQRRAYKQIEEDARAFRAHADKLSAILTKHVGEARRAPVQGYYGKTIPWKVHGLAWEAYARKYGRGQSAERIAERGGFGTCEMDTLLPGWRDMVDAIDAAMQPQPPQGGKDEA